MVVISRGLRTSEIRHNCQLHDPIDGTQAEIMSRSIFGLIYTYNVLPQHVVDQPTTSVFQSLLQRGLLNVAARGLPLLELLCVEGVRTIRVRTFPALFL